VKVKRFRYGYRKTASALHRRVGDCIRSSVVLSGYQIYQEYPVNKVNPSFDSGREKFDWAITDLHIILECHGEQHYRPVTFGGIGLSEARVRFEAQQERDIAKKESAISAGWTYVSIPYTDEDKISEVYILDLIGRNCNNEKLLVSNKEPSVNYKQLYQERKQREEASGRSATARERARASRKQQYERRKQWLANKEEENEDKSNRSS
jgi:hypothetical protein